MAAIGTGVAAIIPPYWEAAQFAQEKIIAFQQTELYETIESGIEQFTHTPQHGSLADVLLAGSIIALIPFAQKSAEYITKGAAKLYDAKLE